MDILVYSKPKRSIDVSKPFISIKDFFKAHSHLKLDLQHLGVYDGCWCIQIYNTTYDFGVEPIYKHYILDIEIETSVLGFEEIIMSIILNWWNDQTTY